MKWFSRVLGAVFLVVLGACTSSGPADGDRAGEATSACHTPPPVVTEGFTLVPSDFVATNYFGAAVAIEGNTIAVGAYGHDDLAGAVYLFTRKGQTWEQGALLIPGDVQPDDQFGSVLALSGDRLAVSGAAGGAVYIFARKNGTWKQEAKITVPSSEYVGAIAMKGETLVFGSSDRDDGHGKAYVYKRTGAWTLQATLVPEDGQPADFFGGAVALHGGTLLIGAFGVDGFRGAAYVFERHGSAWTPETKLTPRDDVPSDSFGVAVALTGDVAAVGGYGSVYLFSPRSEWAEEARLENPGSTGFGVSLAAQGNTIVVGDITDDRSAGSVHVFARAAGHWTEEVKIATRPEDFIPSVFFGQAVALQGSTVVVGEPYFRGPAGYNHGSAFVYKLPPH